MINCNQSRSSADRRAQKLHSHIRYFSLFVWLAYDPSDHKDSSCLRSIAAICIRNLAPSLLILVNNAKNQSLLTSPTHSFFLQDHTCRPGWWWSLLTWKSARCPRRPQSRRWRGPSCRRSCVTTAGWRCSGTGWTGRTAAADAAPSGRARWLWGKSHGHGNIWKNKTRTINWISGFPFAVVIFQVISEVCLLPLRLLTFGQVFFFFLVCGGGGILCYQSRACFRLLCGLPKNDKHMHYIHIFIVPTVHGEALRRPMPW